MSIPKTAFFVDGENLVCRYQAMLADGRKPRTGVIHVQDVFVWHPDITTTSIMNIVRVNYYTSMVGDDHTIEDMRRRIGTTNYEFWYERGMGHEEEIPKGNAAIVPVVFKKPAKSYKSRQVDIRIAIDMLRSAYNQGIDLLVLLSGDGDYLPLVEEVMRHDKETYVAAFLPAAPQPSAGVPTSSLIWIRCSSSLSLITLRVLTLNHCAVKRLKRATRALGGN